MTDIITIRNEGPNIKETNFFFTDIESDGFFYMSFNAGAARLLVPRKHQSMVDDMRAAKHVVISSGLYEGGRSFELMFEDGSSAPFVVIICEDQVDRLLPESENGKSFSLLIYSHRSIEKNIKIEKKAHYRTVHRLPNLQPWGE